MSIDYRALCAQLADELERCRPLAEVPDCLQRARAALAEPVAEVVEPTDEELRELAAAEMDNSPNWEEPECSYEADDPFPYEAPGVAWVNFARAVLARWGHQPAPPAAEEPEVVEPTDEELLELTEDWPATTGPRHDLSGCPEVPLYSVFADEVVEFARAVLARWGHPAPVPVSERLPSASHVYFEFVISDADDCTQAGGIAPTYAQALSEGQHYLAQYQQDGPHTLELRRVEVLHPDALPEQRYPAPVPVSERLPEPSTKVLAHYFNALGKGRTICAIWVPAKSRSNDLDSADDDFMEYNEEDDRFYWPEGWYEAIENWEDLGWVKVDEGEVIYWQPLPKWPALPLPAREVQP